MMRASIENRSSASGKLALDVMTAKVLSPVDIELEGIGHILRDRRLDVPPYQRGYAWEREQVEDFWWDLRAAFGAAASQYFLGTVVLTSADPGHSTIIDGQQRSATTLLLFAALRNEFLRRGDSDRAKVIERQYIVTPELRTARDVPRLTLNEGDRPWLETVIATRPSSTDEHGLDPSKALIVEALVFFEERIREEAKNAGPQWAEVLFQWVEFLEHRARVISVDVSDEADAFLIFETLNARGRELTVADLLKNYLFGLARTELDLLQRRWMSALESLEASADEEIFTTFVRHLWSSLRGATRERELYARMKAAITSKNTAMDFGAQLEDAAPLYAALLSPDHAFWQEKAELLTVAETLLRLGLEQNRPLLLAAMRNFDEDELGRLLRAVISWSVRGLVVGGIGGGTTERAYGEAAVAVTEGRARDAQAVFEELASVVPTDDSFREVFKQKRINRTRLAKYLLIALTQAVADHNDAMLVPDGTEAEYQLKGLLPRNADPDEWRDFPSDELGQFVLRLGNQYVERSGGQPEPAGMLLGAGSWSPETIAERQGAMASLAVSLWPRTP
jgi:hypothetical protein